MTPPIYWNRDPALLRFGVEDERFVFDAGGAVPSPAQIDCLLRILPGFRVVDTDSEGGALVAQRDDPEGPLQVKSDGCTHILEVSYPPYQSVGQFRPVWETVEDQVSRALEGAGVARRTGCCLPSRPPAVQVRTAADQAGRVRAGLCRAVPVPEPDPMALAWMSTGLQVTLNVCDEGLLGRLGALYSMEPLLAHSFCDEVGAGRACGRLAAATSFSDPASPLWGIPSRLPSSLEEHARWRSEYASVSGPRDYSFAALRPPGLVEFRSGCAQSSFDRIEELVAFRIAALLTALDGDVPAWLSEARMRLGRAAGGTPLSREEGRALLGPILRADLPAELTTPLDRVRERAERRFGSSSIGESSLDGPRYILDVARSETEAMDCYRLRCASFSRELGDQRYVDHAGGVFTDRIDEGARHTLLLVREGPRVVATMRVELREDGPFLNDECYEWHALSVASGLPVSVLQAETALISRGAVRPGHRKHGLQRSLVDGGTRVALARGKKVLLGVFLDIHGHGSGTGDPERLGFTRYAHVDSQGLRGGLYWKDLLSIARFVV